MQRQGRALFLLLAATVALSVAAPAAHADPAKATALFEAGMRLYQAGEYEKAIEQFKAGHLEEPDSSFIYNIAQCHRRLGHTQEALDEYRRFLMLDPETPQRGDVERKVAALEDDAAHTPTPAPRLALTPSLPAPRPQDLPPPPAAAAGRSRWPLWVGGALTLAFSAGATFLGLSANERFDSLRASCGRGSTSGTGCSQSDRDNLQHQSLAVNMLWGMAGLSAVATGTWFVVTREGAGVAVALSY